MADIVDRSWDVQRRIEERVKRLGKGKYGRVLKMARKPTSDEYSKVVMITGLGIVAIGALGFVIYLIMRYGPDVFRGLFGILGPDSMGLLDDFPKREARAGARPEPAV